MIASSKLLLGEHWSRKHCCSSSDSRQDPNTKTQQEQAVQSIRDMLCIAELRFTG